MTKLDTNNWLEFKISDLFNKVDLKFKGKRKFSKSMDISETRSEEFNLPLVNAKHNNNGIMYYGRNEDWESVSMTIDIVADGAASTGDVYAQPQETGVLYNAYLIKTKKENISEYVLFFLATVMQRCVKEYFGYDNKCTWDKVKLKTIKLPAKKSGEPDWEYMHEYMFEIMTDAQCIISELVSLTDVG